MNNKNDQWLSILKKTHVKRLVETMGASALRLEHLQFLDECIDEQVIRCLKEMILNTQLDATVYMKELADNPIAMNAVFSELMSRGAFSIPCKFLHKVALTTENYTKALDFDVNPLIFVNIPTNIKLTDRIVDKLIAAGEIIGCRAFHSRRLDTAQIFNLSCNQFGAILANHPFSQQTSIMLGLPPYLVKAAATCDSPILRQSLDAIPREIYDDYGCSNHHSKIVRVRFGSEPLRKLRDIAASRGSLQLTDDKWAQLFGQPYAYVDADLCQRRIEKLPFFDYCVDFCENYYVVSLTEEKQETVRMSGLWHIMTAADEFCTAARIPWTAGAIAAIQAKDNSVVRVIGGFQSMFAELRVKTTGVHVSDDDARRLDEIVFARQVPLAAIKETFRQFCRDNEINWCFWFDQKAAIRKSYLMPVNELSEAARNGSDISEQASLMAQQKPADLTTLITPPGYWQDHTPPHLLNIRMWRDGGSKVSDITRIYDSHERACAVLESQLNLTQWAAEHHDVDVFGDAVTFDWPLHMPDFFRAAAQKTMNNHSPIQIAIGTSVNAPLLPPDHPAVLVREGHLEQFDAEQIQEALSHFNPDMVKILPIVESREDFAECLPFVSNGRLAQAIVELNCCPRLTLELSQHHLIGLIQAGLTELIPENCESRLKYLVNYFDFDIEDLLDIGD